MRTLRLPKNASAHFTALLLLSAAAQPALADGTPFFSATQLGQGRFEFAQKCAVCHGDAAAGRRRTRAQGSRVHRAVERQDAEGVLRLRSRQHAAGPGRSVAGPGLRRHRRLRAGAERRCPRVPTSSRRASPMERVLDFAAPRRRAAVAGGGAVASEDREALRQARAADDASARRRPSSTRPTARRRTG